MESLSQLVPGQTLAVFYSDDNVYHERLALWKQSGTLWMIYTPDSDRYVEDLSGTDPDGPNKVKVKGVDFKYWSRVGGPAYRFRSFPSEAEFRTLLKESFRELSQEADDFDRAWRPISIIDMKGKTHVAADYLGGLLTMHRITRKGGGVLTSEPLCAEDALQRQQKMISDFVPAALPPVDKEWTSLEDSAPYQRGEVLTVDANRDVMNGDLALIQTDSGWLAARLMTQKERDSMLQNGKPASSSHAPEAPVPTAEDKEAEAGSDARTLFIDFDEQNIRYKEWRKVVMESRDYNYSDWPHQGPSTVLHLLTHMHRFGGDPRQWLQLWARQKGVYESDRVMHELRCLTDIFYHAGTFDQLNMPVLSSMEVAARRIQSIVEAYSAGAPGAPDWSNSKLFTGYIGPDDLVSPQLRSWAARWGKEEVEISQARNKMRELKKAATASVSDEAALAVAEGSAPPGASTKRRARGRGRALEAPVNP
eukprot:s178_g5.t1